MEANELFCIELYSLTKLYLMLDKLNEKEQQLLSLKISNENIDTSEYDTKRLSKLAGAVGTYNRTFYSILFAPLENGGMDLAFGRFAKAFYFDYQKFVEQYLTSNRDRVIKEFYSFSEENHIKFSKEDITKLVDDFIKCTLWLINDQNKLKLYPNYITSSDNKKAVLEKVFSRTVLEYYKSLAKPERGLPFLEFCHMGKVYQLPINYAFKYSQKCSPVNIFLLFMNYSKPFNTATNSSQKQAKSIDWSKLLLEVNKIEKDKQEKKRTIINAPNGKPFELQNELHRQFNWIGSTSEGLRLRALEKVKELDKDIENLNYQKSIINRDLNEMLNVLREIPLFYASNPDAIKKMCFLHINKRASNLTDLINLYKTEEWRKKVISSIDNFRSVIALSSANLSKQLSSIQLGLTNNNEALFDLTRKINNLQVDVDVDVKVDVENNN